MKIFVNLRKLSGKPTGIGIYIYNFVKALSQNGVEVIGVTDLLDSELIKELDDIIKIHAFGKKVGKNINVFLFYSYIRRLISDHNPDYFWEPNYIIPLNLKKKNNQIKTIISIHDVIPLLDKRYYSYIYRIYFKIFLKRSIDYADYIFYLSRETKLEAQKVYPSLKRKKTEVIYPIVTAKKIEKPIKDNDYFLYIGSIEKRKGINILIEAYKVYLQKGGEKKLYLCGRSNDKSLLEYIKASVDELDGKLQYLNYIAETEKDEVLRCCSAFIFPSYMEGFGLPPLEAMMYFKPIILSDIKIFREIFQDSVNYFDLSGDEQDIINNLLDAMVSFNTNIHKYDEIINKFDEQSAKRIISFLQ